MSIYDLRFTKPQALTNPYITISGSYASDRYGLGFDYDPILGLVATAHGSGDRVSLFSTRTGKLVESPINKHNFAGPYEWAERGSVTDIKFANIREPVRGKNGVKSIFTANGVAVEEWSVEGGGVESEMQKCERGVFLDRRTGAC